MFERRVPITKRRQVSKGGLNKGARTLLERRVPITNRRQVSKGGLGHWARTLFERRVPITKRRSAWRVDQSSASKAW